MRNEFKSSIHQWKYKKKIDNFVESLQNKIMEKEIEDYNEYIVNLFHNPKNWGKPPENEIL